MLRTPWEDRLLAVLPTDPSKADADFFKVVQEDLSYRRSQRLESLEVAGTDDDRRWSIPSASYWSGEYHDLPSAATEHNISYNIVFKGDGAVVGSGSSSEGSFSIRGVYNCRTGTVAWRQEAESCPVWHNPCTRYGVRVESEFFGVVSNFEGNGPTRISGTFLTDLGRYCEVNLVCRGPSQTDTGIRTAKRRARGVESSKFAPDSKEQEEETLPTLLTSSITGWWNPVTDDQVKRRQFLRQVTTNSDTFCGPYSEDELIV